MLFCSEEVVSLIDYKVHFEFTSYMFESSSLSELLAVTVKSASVLKKERIRVVDKVDRIIVKNKYVFMFIVFIV